MTGVEREALRWIAKEADTAETWAMDTGALAGLIFVLGHRAKAALDPKSPEAREWEEASCRLIEDTFEQLRSQMASLPIWLPEVAIYVDQAQEHIMSQISMTKTVTPQWTKAELEDWCRDWTRTPHTVLKAFIDAGFCSDQAPSRAVMALVPLPCDPRPAEPEENEMVSYRGWECCWHAEAYGWGCEGWVAYFGGPDENAPSASGRTWEELLDEIDDHPLTGAA